MKNTIFLTLLLLLISCQNKEQALPLNQSNENIEIAKKLFEAFNNLDWELMAGYYAETAKFLDPSYGIDYVEKEQSDLVEKYSGMEKMSQDIKDSITGIYSDGNKVIIEFISSGTSPNGDKWRLPLCTVLTIENGKIVRDATYYDK